MINIKNILYLAKAIFIALAIYFVVLNHAIAAEEILSFVSHIHVHEDSSMTVTEKIIVRAEGRKIKRGIYRDFPTKYQGRLGNKIKVGFEILEVLRDGNKEPYYTKPLINGIRIYIGDKNRYVAKGQHTYTIKYKTNQQLGYFETHDELYWNVTGNGWDFPILEARASVHLPDSISVHDVNLEAYTGHIGSTQQIYENEVSLSGNYLFKTTQALASRQGLTIVVSWPKGHVFEPNFNQKLTWWWQANIQNPISVLGMFGLLIFYLISWLHVGKDPEQGVIIPHYQPPKGFPPGALKYINDMGHDKKVFTAAVLNLAVKGYLKIKEVGSKYELQKLKNPDIRLPVGEQAILSNLFENHETKIILKNKNHKVISSAISEHKKALKQEYGQSYFIHNRKIFFTGVVITILIGLYTFLKIPGSDNKGSALFLIFWLSIWTPVTAALIYAWYQALRRKLSGEKASDLGSYTLFAGVWSVGEVGALTALGIMIGLANGLLLVLLFILNIIFYYLLKKPTMKGRKLLDKVEGFKKYLEVAEQEELNLIYPPRKTPKLFETYLPYALALGVENQWTEQFTEVFNTSEESSDYHPTWYSGNNWNANKLPTFTNSIGSSLSSAISSSATAPGSSSGSSSFGGGGSSGGGGGGGGGGGW